ncbi:MAG: metalloregulator ArsR/SmtB family transcription factor [Pseudomonadota bacterium]
MPKYLDPVFAALSDPTRRQVVERLSQGPASVSELAKPFAMSLPAFVQHLGVLEDSGLIGSRKQGRVRTCYLERAALDRLDGWVAQVQGYWETRLGALTDYAQARHQQNREERES